MYPAQSGWQQPHNQQGYNPGYSGQPPAKKPKGNPVITKYPPPPGYRGPAQPQPQPQPPYQQPAWQPPGQTPGYGQHGYQGYPQQPYNAPQPYSAPQPYQQPQWPGYQHPQYPSTGYAPPQGYYPPPTAGYPAPQPGWQAQASAPQSAPHQAWQHPSTSFQQNKRRHNSAPFPHARNVSSALVDGNGDPFPPAIPSIASVEDLEDDFDGECYYARRPDEVNPLLSLGIIEWQAPLPTKLALPSTFQEAELEALAPRMPKAGVDDSISDYFTNEKREEALLSVRQTDAWEEVKDDVIFKEFPPVCSETLSTYELLERYRDRPDPDWTSPPPDHAPTPTPEMSRQPTPAQGELSRDSMDLDGRYGSSDYIKREDDGDPGDVLGNLEQALFSSGPANGHAAYKQTTAGGRNSRTASITSQTGKRITRPEPLAPVRDRAQESILAALGVTGSPKVVYQTPGPAFGAPPSQQDSNRATLSRHNSLSSNQGRFRPPPPPPGQQRSPSYDAWKTNDRRWSNGHAAERPSSSASQHTAAGSDFHSDDQDATPRPKFGRTDNRKRSHGEFEDGGGGDRRWQGDDATPRARHKQQRVEGPYSRRW